MTSIAYLVSAVALTGVGLFLIVDSGRTLLTAEHPTIGSVRVLGVTFWFGWVMIAALVYSAVPPIIFGRLKLKPARALHDKILFADALMNKADWMTGLAAVGGILGIGMGWWWADAAAAVVIAADVLHDGVKHKGHPFPGTERRDAPDDRRCGVRSADRGGAGTGPGAAVGGRERAAAPRGGAFPDGDRSRGPEGAGRCRPASRKRSAGWPRSTGPRG